MYRRRNVIPPIPADPNGDNRTRLKEASAGFTMSVMKRCVITQAMLDRIPPERRRAWIAYRLKRAGFSLQRTYEVEYRADLQLYVFVQTESHPYLRQPPREPISLEGLRKWLQELGIRGDGVRLTGEGGIRGEPSLN